MKLSIHAVFEHLPDTICGTLINAESKPQPLKYAMLYQSGDRMDSDVLWVSRPESLPSAVPPGPVTLACVGGAPSAAWLESNNPVIVFPSERDVFKVYRALVNVFNDFSEWSDSLRDLVEDEEHFDIKKVMESGVKAIGTDIYLTIRSSRGYLKCFNSQLNDASPEKTVSVSDQYVEVNPALDNGVESRVLNRTPFYAIDTQTPDKTNSYCCNLYISDTYCGTLVILENRKKLSAGDMYIADYFFCIFEKAYRKHIMLSSPDLPLPAYADTLHKLLNGSPVSDSELTTFSLAEDESWCLFQIDSCVQTNGLSPYNLGSSLYRMVDGCFFTIYQEKLVGLLRCDASGHWKKKLPGDEISNSLQQTYGFETNISCEVCVKNLLEATGYRMGTSRSFTNIFAAKRYLVQAEAALNIGKKSDPKEHLLLFDNYIVEYILKYGTQEFSIEDLIPTGLIKLHEHDLTSDVSYIDTLKVYMQHNMNMTDAAKALYLHRSSLVSRIERIMQILDMDLSSPYIRLYLLICIFLMDNASI